MSIGTAEMKAHNNYPRQFERFHALHENKKKVHITFDPI